MSTQKGVPVPSPSKVISEFFSKTDSATVRERLWKQLCLTISRPEMEHHITYLERFGYMDLFSDLTRLIDELERINY